MNQQVVEDILLFERGIQDGVRSARKNYMQYRVLWNMAVGICGFAAVYVLFSLVTRHHLDTVSYVSLAVFGCSFLVLEFIHEQDDVGRHCCRLNQVLRNFNIYYSPDTKTLFQLSPFHKQKKGRSPSGKARLKRDDNKSTDSQITPSSTPTATTIPQFPSGIGEEKEVGEEEEEEEHPKSE